MRRLLALAALLGAAGPVLAQDYPAPGTGLLSFERVGNRPFKTYAFDFADSGTVVATTIDSLIYLVGNHLPPAERTWQARVRAYSYRSLLVVGASEDTLLSSNGGYIERTPDGGYTRELVYDEHGSTAFGGPFYPGGFIELPPGHPHAGRILAGGGFWYSDNRGRNWTTAGRDCDSCGAHAFAVLPSGRILAAGGWGIAASADGGASYAVTPIWGENRFLFFSIVPLATPGSRQSGAPACGLPDPAACDGAAAVGVDATLPHVGIWTTNDGGRSWSGPQALAEPYDGIGGEGGIVALGTSPDGLGRALAIGRRGIMYRTLDGGQTWEIIGRMPVQPDISHRAEFMRLGPDGHVWVAMAINGPQRTWMLRSVEPAEAAFVVAGESGPEAGAVRLTVRPNPSSGAVSVSVVLAAPASSAVVTMHDARGRQVAVLHDGPLAAGTHAVGVEASALAPGVYVVRVAAGSTVTTARLVVAR